MPFPDLLPEHYSPPQHLLSNRRIVVIGAATDLGNAVSMYLAKNGAELVFIERKERLVSELYDNIVAEGGTEPLSVALDLSKAGPEHLAQLANGLSEEYDAIEGIVYLATSAAPLSPIQLSKQDVWQSFYQTTVLTPTALVSALLPLLENAENPSVVFPSLSCGRTGKAYWGPVGAAFAALNNVCETFADEQTRMRFNTLSPGKVASAVRHKYYPAEAGSTLRACDDPVVLNHFLYLLDPATTLTGKHLRVPDKE